MANKYSALVMEKLWWFSNKDLVTGNILLQKHDNSILNMHRVYDECWTDVLYNL